MKVEIEICDICGAQHDTRCPVRWETVFTPINSGWSYDGQNLPHRIPSVCRACREVVTDAIARTIDARSALKTFPPVGRKQIVNPDVEK